MRFLFTRPTYSLLTLWLVCLATVIASLWFLTSIPSLGLAFESVEGQVRVAKNTAPQGASVPVGATLLSVGGVAVDADILNNDVDMVYSDDMLDAYFDRQSRLDAQMQNSHVELVWLDAQDRQHQTVIQPQPRKIGSLPPEFWFIHLVWSVCLLISAWVFILKPSDWGARFFLLTGVSLAVSIFPASIHIARELSMEGAVMRACYTINHAGANLFGGALISLMLAFPKRLVSPPHLFWMPALYAAFSLAEYLRVTQSRTDSLWLILALMLSAIAALMQWRRSYRHPLEREALRWFLWATATSMLLVAVTFILPPLLGMQPLVTVTYAMGFFLIMYLGIAVGLRKHRLFDLDEWAYRVFLWVAGVSAVILMDALLIGVGLEQSASLGLTLLVCGGLYFPFRQWLWQRIVKRQFPKLETLLPELSAIAFSASSAEQRARWNSFLERVFDPLEIKHGDVESKKGAVLEQGLALQVPTCGLLPSCTLRYAGRGSRLFSTRDADFAIALCQLLQQMIGKRSSYEQGVTQERLRIGRDLHDNIGARLLKLIHHLRGTPDAEIARDAMKDLRTAIAAMDAPPVPLTDALADWRAEAGARCEAAQCQLSWEQGSMPNVDLSPRMKSMLESVMREIITNALKHASPDMIRVTVEASAVRLEINVENDGDIADPLTWADGYGLRNIRGRMEELGGNLNITTPENRVCLTTRVPLS